MSDGAQERLRVAPIFVIGDDDREAIERLTRYLPLEWFYFPVWDPFQIVRYAEHYATTAVFLADGIEHPEGGTGRILQQLLDRVGKPVVILAEAWSPEVKERWMRMGAADCIPHPTRLDQRLDTLKRKMQELALATRESRTGP